VNIAVTSLIDPDVDLSEYIFVNETDLSVVVAAGISQRVLLDYLAAYGTENGGDGYTLSAFAWYIDQSMGGAIATDTHGSSLTHGSLSSREQLTDLWIMTANGTILHLNDEINEHLMSAARVSVGRLGVILYAKLNIIPQTMILRTSDELDEQTVLDDLLAVSDAYRETGELPLDELNDVNFFWFPQASSFYRVSFRPDDQTPPVGEAPGPDDELMSDGIETATSGTSGLGYARDFVNDVLLAGDAPLEPMLVDSFSGPEGIEASLPEIPPGIEREGPSAWTFSFRGFGAAVFKGVFYNTQISTGSFPRRTAYIAQTDEQDFIGIQYDQYELAVPLENAGTCLRGVVDLIEGLDARDSILTPPLIRFVSESPAYLSHTSDGPAIFINVEVRRGSHTCTSRRATTGTSTEPPLSTVRRLSDLPPVRRLVELPPSYLLRIPQKPVRLTVSVVLGFRACVCTHLRTSYAYLARRTTYSTTTTEARPRTSHFRRCSHTSGPTPNVLAGPIRCPKCTGAKRGGQTSAASTVLPSSVKVRNCARHVPLPHTPSGSLPGEESSRCTPLDSSRTVHPK